MAVDAPAVAGSESAPEAPTRMGPGHPPPTDHQTAVASIAARRALPPTEEVASAPAPGPTHTVERSEPLPERITGAKESAEPITPEPTTPETEVAPEESQEAEAEESLTESDADTTAEAEPEPEPITSIEELPDTVTGIAEALEIDADALLDHIKVPLPGTDQSITLREAQKGYLREDTFTRKTTELADDRQRFAAEMQEQHETVKGRIDALDVSVAAVRNLMGEQPSATEMAALAQTDPEHYAQLDAQQKAVNAVLEAANVARQKAIDDAVAEKTTRRARTRDEQQKLLVEAMPELKDPKETEKFQVGMASYLRSRGKSDQQIVAWANGDFDHADILIVRDAMQTAAAKKAAPVVAEKLKTKKRVLKPGGSRGGKNSAATQLSTLRDSLKAAPDRRSQESAAVNLIRLKRTGKS